MTVTGTRVLAPKLQASLWAIFWFIYVKRERRERTEKREKESERKKLGEKKERKIWR